MLTPALLGGGSVGFIFRDIPQHFSSLVERNAAYTLAALIAASLWQFLPLCLFLFWLRLATLPRSLREFARASSVSGREFVRHVAWPHSRHLAFVLTLFTFVQGCAEYGQSLLMFHPSEETGTLMLSHWIELKHAQLSKNFAPVARELALDYSGLFLLVVLVASLVTAYCVSAWLIRATALVLAPAAAPHARHLSEQGRAWIIRLMLVATLAPLALLLPHVYAESPRTAITSFALALSLSVGSLPWVAAAALVTAIGAISFGIVLRLLWPQRTERFGVESLPLLSLVILIHAIPAMGLAYCAHYWSRVLHFGAPLFWLTAESTAAFSAVGAFVVYVHFDIPTNEVTFYRGAQATVIESAWTGFITRFRSSYLLIVVFAMATILNEDTLNATLATHFNSFIASLSSAQVKDYPAAAASILLIAALAAALSLGWTRLSPSPDASQHAD